MTSVKGSRSSNSHKIFQQIECYLEKHRIFELLQELSIMLLIKQPKDHVLFLKQSLSHAARRLDAPRIIILTSSAFDVQEMSQILKKNLNIPIITLNDIVSEEELALIMEPDMIIEKLRIIILNYMKKDCDGWIILNYPRSDTEARCLQRGAIIPTHVIEIAPSAKISESSNSTENSTIFNYYKEIQGLRRIFAHLITKISVGKKSVEDVAEECLNVVKRRNYHQSKVNYRILLIDLVKPARSKCLAKHISRVFNVMYIDFHEILEKISLCESDLGDELREMRENTDLNSLPTEIKIKAFEHFASKTECLSGGFVLIKFINSIVDFKHLDMTDSPPNRVLIIVPKNYKPREDSISKTESEISEDSVQPNTEENYICECDEDIINYAGESANVIKEHDDIKVMKEKIETILTAPAPCVPPRIPREPSIIKFEDIEFDPDDQPNVDIFDSIREPEPVLNLI